MDNTSYGLPTQIVKQTMHELQTLPDNLVQEVLDFIGYLQNKYNISTKLDIETSELVKTSAKSLLTKDTSNTFGSWEDNRSAEEIIDDIYNSRNHKQVNGLHLETWVSL